MKGRPLGSLWEWDELELLRAEAGQHLRGPSPSGEDLANASRIFASIPGVKLIEITTGDDWFGVAPAPEQPSGQVALAGLLQSVRHIGWRVSNIRRRFDPALALRVAKLRGWHTLGWRNSWIKVTAPAGLAVERGLQRHPESVDNMVAALKDRASVIDLEAFQSLSRECISRPMPREEATQYFMAMR